MDHCSHCDENAYCDNGNCHCNEGYEGTGYIHECHEIVHHHHYIEGILTWFSCASKFFVLNHRNIRWLASSYKNTTSIYKQLINIYRMQVMEATLYYGINNNNIAFDIPRIWFMETPVLQYGQNIIEVTLCIIFGWTMSNIDVADFYFLKIYGWRPKHTLLIKTNYRIAFTFYSSSCYS